MKTKKRDDGCLKSRAKKKDVRDDDDEDGQREQKENHERDDDDDGFVRRQSFERNGCRNDASNAVAPELKVKDGRIFLTLGPRGEQSDGDIERVSSRGRRSGECNVVVVVDSVWFAGSKQKQYQPRAAEVADEE